MKKIILVMVLISVGLFGGLYLRQARQGKETEEAIPPERGTGRDEPALDAARQTQSSREATNSLPAQSDRENHPASAPAADEQTNYPDAVEWAKMVKEPATNETILRQQKEMLRIMTEENYAKLFAALQLAPDQTAALKDLLLRKKALGSEVGEAILAAGDDKAKLEEIVRQDKTNGEAIDVQIRQILGDERFSKLQEYDQTEPDRAAVGRFAEQLSGSSMPLTANQEQQLVQVTAEERKKFKFATVSVDHSKPTQDLAAMFTEERVSKLIEELARLDEVSAQPLPYPHWHQAKTSADRLSPADLSLLARHIR